MDQNQLKTAYIQARNFWASLGFLVIPGDYETKRPKVSFAAYCSKGGHKRPPEFAVAEWETWQNITPLLLLDSNPSWSFVVVDLDGDLKNTIPWLTQRYGLEFAVTTGRSGGGIHSYYWASKAVPQCNGGIGPDSAFMLDDSAPRGKWGRSCVDVKSASSYVVAPGAFHKSGKRYLPRLRQNGGVEPIGLDDLHSLTAEQLKGLLPQFKAELYDADKAYGRALRAKARGFVGAGEEIAEARTVDLSAGGDEPFLRWCFEQPSDVTLSLWWGLAINLITALGDERARPEFHRISAADPRYKSQEASATYERALASHEKGGKPSTYRRLVEEGYDGPIPRGYRSPAHYLKREKTVQWEAYDKNGQPISIPANTGALIRYLGLSVRRNVFTHGPEWVRDGETVEVSDSFLPCRAEELGYRVSDERLYKHIDDVAALTPHHPVLSWLGIKSAQEARANWFGVDMWQKVWATLHLAPGQDEELLERLARCWFRQGAKILLAGEWEGSVASEVLVLAGNQGTGKTRWLSRLTHPDLCLNGILLDPSDKDLVKRVLSKWIVEIGELDATFRRSDIAALKSFLSRDLDLIRPPYGRSDLKFPRKTLFCASVNGLEFLRDATGNRRYLPVEIVSCDWQALELLDMRQFWLQMLCEVLDGAPTWVDAEDTKYNDKYQDKGEMAETLEAVYQASTTDVTEFRDMREQVAKYLYGRPDAALNGGERRALGIAATAMFGAPRRTNGKTYYNAIRRMG